MGETVGNKRIPSGDNNFHLKPSASPLLYPNKDSHPKTGNFGPRTQEKKRVLPGSRTCVDGSFLPGALAAGSLGVFAGPAPEGGAGRGALQFWGGAEGVQDPSGGSSTSGHLAGTLEGQKKPGMWQRFEG